MTVCKLIELIKYHFKLDSFQKKPTALLSPIITRNTVSNAHNMIPPAPPCFVWQSPCFALGNPKIMRIKM